MKLDFKELGLRVGLEIHQQLDTKRKLFCNCPPYLSDEKLPFTIVRKLRPTQSELHQVDPAALFEFKKGKYYVYEVCRDTTCLVECDEEPPHAIDEDALRKTLKIALMFNAVVLDEIHVMRKIVIDGSNTTGFQRTAIIAVNGQIPGENVKIQTICLEEEAARIIEKDQRKTVYRLDRLGIPLVEISTSSNISSPEEAYRIARKIGLMLRLTGDVKRGLGTIRQDLNISIARGARIEVKGVQKLEDIPKIIENEVIRQLNLIKIAEELSKRGISKSMIKNESFTEVTKIFKDTRCKFIQNAIKRGEKVYAIKLPGFNGLLGTKVVGDRTLGKEFAERVSFWSGLKGILHTDELPKYGISKKEVEDLRKFMRCRDEDAVIIVICNEKALKDVSKAIIERAIEALEGVPPETRVANPDATTSFLRPLPGPARMYPETDIPPIRVTEVLLRELSEKVPLTPEEKLEEYVSKLGLDKQTAERILWSRYQPLFDTLIAERVATKLALSLILNIIPSLKRESVNVDAIPEDKIVEIMKRVSKGEIAKEAIPEILTQLSEKPDAAIDVIISKLKVTGEILEKLDNFISNLVTEKRNFILERGEHAVKPLMGIVMKEFRGKVDGRIVYEKLSAAVKKVLGDE